ncbi:hypothetical protein SAMN04487939_13331 [Lysobacter sp. yr284]|uniref:hypothetical protein n=1 Tax=Lysobacter sp. yr284 TaxID=1761791 RepID=UPI00089D3A3B|nr:hypothetical protein [Lysobacter sp. yr284]SDZ29604.1 hypothetical protein SAMN04487939_13331 [Lysobacter sp. yr284]
MTEPLPPANEPAARVPDAQRNRNRLTLLLIAAFFLVPMLVAGIMRFTDRHPAINRQHGELLAPKPDLRELAPSLADGKPYPWNPEARVWRILVAPRPDCAEACAKLSHELDTVWQLFGKDADQVDILWLGEPPAGAARPASLRVLGPAPQLRERLPRLDDPAGTPVYVVDPNGFVILRYAPGFQPGGLRTDLSRLLKLM